MPELPHHGCVDGEGGFVMTRKAWETKALREAERKLGVPEGWWGTYVQIETPHGIRVRFSGRDWIVRNREGAVVTRRSTRTSAIAAAKKLVRDASQKLAVSSTYGKRTVTDAAVEVSA